MAVENQFQRPKRMVFPVEGVDTNSPIDTPKNRAKAAKIKNLSVDTDGSLTLRPGLASRLTVGGLSPVHSMRRLNDPSTGLWIDIVGVSTQVQGSLSINPNAIGTLSTGFSGNPLSIIPWRPTQTPRSFAYVYDTAKQVKIDSSGVVSDIGVTAPTVPPTVELYPRATKFPYGTSAVGAWVGDGTIFKTASIAAFTRATATIFKALYDNTNLGGACYVLSNVTDFGPGDFVLIFGFGGIGADQVIIDEVTRAAPLVTVQTSSILYDSGTSGLCTISLQRDIRNLKRNSVVAINTGVLTEYTRVLEVTRGKDDVISFRCVLNNTHFGGEQCTLVNSIRVSNSSNAFDATNGTAKILAIQIDNSTGGGTKATGKGQFKVTGLTVDLSAFDGAIRPTTTFASPSDDDYFHLSLRCNDWTQVSLLRVLFDVDDGSFTKNYYWYAIEQNRLAQAAKGNQLPTDGIRRGLQDGLGQRPFPGPVFQVGPESATAGDGLLSSTESTRIRAVSPGGSGIPFTDPNNYPYPVFDPFEGYPQPVGSLPSGGGGGSDPTTGGGGDGYGGRHRAVGGGGGTIGQGGTGDNQWAEIFWHRGSMVRAGTDQSKDWQNVTAIMIEVNIRTDLTTPTVIVGIDSLYLQGGGSLDISEAGLPYQYRYRYRDPKTGATSDYSPSSRSGVLPLRTNTFVQIPGSSVGQRIDVERFGGLQGGWCYVGTVDDPGSAITATYTDVLSDFAALQNGVNSDLRVAKPWVKRLDPMSGTFTQVCGTMCVNDNTTRLPLNLIPGTIVLVGGVATLLRRPMTTDPYPAMWEMVDSFVAATNVKWEIPNPVTAGNPIGRVFGPFQGCMFALDGNYIRWSFGYNPDATSERNVREVTDPSDTTVAGFVFNGRAGVLTTRKLLSISGDPVNGFDFVEVPYGKGAITPYGIAVGPRVAWIAKDGIYESSGDEPDDITTADLAPIFSIEGRLGQNVFALNAPSISTSEQANLRLAYLDDGSLMFSYNDSLGARHHLRYDRDRKRWFPYDYMVNITTFYALEGDGTTGVLALGAGPSPTSDSKIYTVGGSTNPTTDDGTGFPCQLRPFSDDFGDSRSKKLAGDLTIDVDPAGLTSGITALLMTDRQTASVALDALTGATRTTFRRDINSGAGVRSRDFSIDLSWTTEANKKQRLYLWELALLNRPESTGLRWSDYTYGGYDGDKYMQAIKINADTFGVDKTFRVEYDGGQVGDTITINHNGMRRETYSFSTPFIARLLRIATDDTDEWEVYDFEYVYNREPPAAKVWQIQFTGFDIPGYKHVPEIRPAFAAPADVTMSLYADTSTPYYTLNIGNTGSSNYTDLERPSALILPAKKLKLWAARFESDQPFRMYLRDIELLVKGWASDGDYQLLKPFGDIHRDEGARA